MSWYSTTMYHNLYLTFTLSIILNNCALNRANVADVDLSDNEYTWLDGEKYCRARAPNGQMLSPATYLSYTNAGKMPSTNYSFWIRSVRIDEQKMYKYIITNAGVDESLKGVRCLYNGQVNACGSARVINITQPTDIYNALGQPSDNTLRVSDIDYSSLFQADASDGHNSTILCYMITKEGDIAIDDCNTTKRVACINGTFLNYIDFVEKEEIITTTTLGTTSTTVEGTSTNSYVQNNRTEHVLSNTTTDTTTPSRATTPAGVPLVAGISGAVVGLLVIIIVVFLYWKSRSKRRTTVATTDQVVHGQEGSLPLNDTVHTYEGLIGASVMPRPDPNNYDVLDVGTDDTEHTYEGVIGASVMTRPDPNNYDVLDVGTDDTVHTYEGVIGASVMIIPDSNNYVDMNAGIHM